jgi:hypothetical protein
MTDDDAAIMDAIMDAVIMDGAIMKEAREMSRNKAAVLAALLTIGLAACGEEQAGDNTSDQAKGRSGEPQSTEQAAEDEDDIRVDGPVDLDAAEKFVKITACVGAPDMPAGVAATVEVTNTLDVPMEYLGRIDFFDGAGAPLTEGVFNTGTLAPGAKATEEIPGANVYSPVPNVTCELVEVKSDNPA